MHAHPHAVRIDRTKPLAAEPHSGHNRYHPDIAPALEVAEGEEVVLETRTPSTGRSARTHRRRSRQRSTPAASTADRSGFRQRRRARRHDGNRVPRYRAAPFAFSSIVPGLGFLRDVMTTPFVVHWNIKDGWATAAEIPRRAHSRRAVHGHLRHGAVRAKLKEWTEREQRALDAGGFVMTPSPEGAVPGGRCGLEGFARCRRAENGGNFDVKQLTKGSSFAAGVHQRRTVRPATHISPRVTVKSASRRSRSGATVAVRFKIHKELAKKRTFAGPVFSHKGFFADPKHAVPENFSASWACRSTPRARSKAKT